MSDYYNWLIESLAEWFMQLFFDPAYQVELPLENVPPAASKEFIERIADVKAVDWIEAIATCFSTCFERMTVRLQDVYVFLMAIMFRHPNLQIAFNQWKN